MLRRTFNTGPAFFFPPLGDFLFAQTPHPHQSSSTPSKDNLKAGKAVVGDVRGAKRMGPLGI